MKRFLALILLLSTLLSIFSSPVCAATAVDRESFEGYVASKLGGQPISMQEVPENVIVLEFDSVEEAMAYFELERRMSAEGRTLSLTSAQVEQNYNERSRSIKLSNMNLSDELFVCVQETENYDTETIRSMPLPADKSAVSLNATTYNGTKKASFLVGIFTYINVRANYKYSGKKFTKINSVTSNISGLTIGVDWVQDDYCANITANGKKLSATVYGHFKYYILIKTSFFRVGSNDEEYSVTWTL